MKRVSLGLLLVACVAACSSPKAKSCSVVKQSDGSVDISCPDGSSTTVSPGKDGTNGSSCTVTDNGDGSSTISCADGTSVVVHSGTDGSSCSVVKQSDGSVKISCTGGSSATVSPGKDGSNGSNCTVTDNGDGSSTISCADGTSVVVHSGTNGSSCSVADAGSGTHTITCDDGTSVTVVDGTTCTVATDPDGSRWLRCDDGTQTRLDPAALVDITDEPPGYTCPNGGVRIATGIDDNGDGILEPGEVDSVRYVCGQVGSATECGNFPYDPVYLHPSPGSTDAIYDEPVSYASGVAMDSIDLTLARHADGSAVSGTVVTDLSAGRAVFQPDANLDPLTDYDGTITLSAKGCTVTHDFSFTTSALGQPIANAGALAGQVWVGGFDSGWGDFGTLAGYGDSRARLRVDAVRDLGLATAQLDLTFAWAQTGSDTQDACIETTAMTADFSAAPAFDATFSQLPFSFAGSELLLYDGHLRGVFAPDLSTIGGVTLDAWVDAAQAAVYAGVDQNGYCNLEASLGFTCVACPMGGPDQCIHFVEHDMTFTALPGGSVVDIASDQRENHLCAGSCTDGADNDGDGLADTDPECNPAAWP